ncbi:sigma-70 family RNA polymerase sigma factor [Sorangium sp. So ce388]|uniref:sigma-70 family RNA polymerase sigma factor n=1 Tax=Sorangium sp. So ce388 TaxID=3133309 RepID=UPI003F5BD3F9
MSQEVPSITELIARARSGDQTAIDRLFEWCRPWVSRYLAKRHRGIARRSDIVQEATARAFRALPDFEGTTEGEWLAWLRRIVETCTTQHFRDAARQKRNRAGETSLVDDDIPAQQVSPSQATATEEQWRQVFTQIFQLPDEQRQAIYLCHLKELSVADAAAQMGKTQGAVSGLLQRGLRTLRERMTTAPDPGAPDAGSPRRTQAQDEAASALLVYLRRRDAGEHVAPAAFIAEHPSCAEELRHMLEWIERIQALRPANLKE